MSSPSENMYCKRENNTKRYKVQSKHEFRHEVIDTKTNKLIVAKGDFMTAVSYKDKLNCGLNPKVKFAFE